jgi:ankyrin repeat protein
MGILPVIWRLIAHRHPEPEDPELTPEELGMELIEEIRKDDYGRKKYTFSPARAAELINAGADLTVTAGSGMTALHWAARHDRIGTAIKLINAKADIHARMSNGDTPRDVARYVRAFDMVQLLEEYDPVFQERKRDAARKAAEEERLRRAEERKIQRAFNAFMQRKPTAPEMGRWLVQELNREYCNTGRAARLVKAGADLHVRDTKTGLKPLALAAFVGQSVPVRAILARGEDPDADIYGKYNALYWAHKKNYQDIVDIIHEAEGKIARANLPPGFITPLPYQ